jgi:excisionase family DNA binding protein
MGDIKSVREGAIMAAATMGNLGFTRDEALATQRAVCDLAEKLSGTPEAKTVRLHVDGEALMTIDLPVVALRFLHAVASRMAQGESVVLNVLDEELTTQRAADFLGVSRPFVVGLLERGEIAHRVVGTHRRVKLRDLMEYKRQSLRARREASDELTAQAQELNLGY